MLFIIICKELLVKNNQKCKILMKIRNNNKMINKIYIENLWKIYKKLINEFKKKNEIRSKNTYIFLYKICFFIKVKLLFF
jgi:hypothetical protein